MDPIVLQVATWWAIAAIGGVLEWTNRRIMAGFCVLVMLVGFTFTVSSAVTSRGERREEFVAAKTGNDYHRAGSVCVRNIDDPIKFTTEDEAQDSGFCPCERCILHEYDFVVARRK